MILKTIDTKTLKDMLSDEFLREEVMSEVYCLARKFASSNKISHIEFEDYVQDLVILASSVMNRFDSNKANLPTFLYMWFRSYCSLQLKKKRVAPLSLDENVSIFDDFDGTALDLLIDDYEEITHKLEINNALCLCDIPLQLYLEGYSQTQISKMLNISRRVVRNKIEANIDFIRETLDIDDINEYYDFGI